ncbi:MAG: pantetheine-phosphate adenylyltransferase [Clostridiales bacterium]|nr:pantetheine-phosphate adenylyltransferase [Clostridiales bacterium]
MSTTCVYAGSFDPVTVGHEDIIRRAAKLCDRLLVTVMYNPAKSGCFSVNERMAMLSKVTADIPNVEVDAWNGLMVDYVKKVDADFVVRGIRGVADLESETNLAELNRRLLPGLETVFLLTRPDLACISSSAVREAALFQADLSGFVPPCIQMDVKEHFENR